MNARAGSKTARRSARAFAPASVSNVGCGFDVLGFALEAGWLGEDSPPVGDIVEASLVERPGVRIATIRGARGLPLAADLNTAGVAATAVLRAATGEDEPELGLELVVDKCMPLRSGLGSSAASAVAAAVATDAVLEAGLPADRLLRCALAGEQLASGTLHADNVAPALYGGFVLVRSLDPIPDVISLPTPAELFCAVVAPALEVDTGAARTALPREIPLTDAIRQWGNLGALVAALYREDFSLLANTLDDHVAEPHRAAAVPGLDRVKAAAVEAGALGAGLSGSGPSVFALARGERTARAAARAMQSAFAVDGVASRRLVSRLAAAGARVLD